MSGAPLFGRFYEDGLADAFKRLGIEAEGMSLFEGLAHALNRIADLEERLEAHEKASKGP